MQGYYPKEEKKKAGLWSVLALSGFSLIDKK